MKKILLILLCLMLTGCASTGKIMESWIGHQKSEIINSWGPPQRYSPDGKGGEILIYESSSALASPIGEMMITQTITNYKQVYVNQKGTIYYVRWGSR